MIEFLTTMAAPAMKPVIEVAVKKACGNPCAGRMPARENGIAPMMIRGVRKDCNHPATSAQISASTAANAIPGSRNTS